MVVPVRSSVTSRDGPVDGVADDVDSEVVGLALEEDPPPSGTMLYSGATPLRVPGVGSKRTQPSRGKYSSGQAWASETRTTRSSPSIEPGRNPDTIRAGMPAARESMTMAEVNCTQ